jgi:3-hydroxyisobutyrate dehydrogenase-like beta-hydroxyacid dehydrogenase
MPARKKTRTRKGAVGVVGLGIMGGAYARLLVKSGWDVAGFDTNAARRREAARAGVRIVADAKAVAAAAPIIITSLPSPAALESSIAGIIAAKTPRRILIEAGTFSLADKMKAAETMQAAGHVALDCPVSGTGAQAAVGDIVVYASGDTATIRKLRPLFAGFSRGTYDLGAYGNGSRMKYVANLLVAIHNVASAEAMVLGIKAGLDPQVVHDLVVAGAGTSRVFQLRAPMMVRNRYDEPTMKISIWQKDMAVIGDYAAKTGCPTPLFSATLPIYAAAMATGHGAEDTAAVCAVLEDMAGVERARGASRPSAGARASRGRKGRRRARPS